MPVRPLRESERQLAYETARQRILGPEPVLKKSLALPSKYPPLVIGIVLFMCAMVLIAAFVPSALRLSKAGREEFCPASEDIEVVVDQEAFVCHAVGVSAVLLAETGSIVFILALSVVVTTTRIQIFRVDVDPVRVLLWTSALVCVGVAVVGNAHVGKPWIKQQLFDYLIVFVPPALVLTVGYILKDFLLQAIAGTVEQNASYNEKVAQRKFLEENPEDHPRWLQYYSRALKERLVSANSRREIGRAHV